jgi:hypothetical protein
VILDWKRVVIGINLCWTRGICLELTIYAFQLDPFVFFCCRKHMVEVWWATLVPQRRWMCWLLISFGHKGHYKKLFNLW